MALTQASLKDKLKTELAAIFSIIDATTLDKACGAIAKAIVDEITTNAVVTTTVSNVEPGVGSANGTGGVS